MTEISMEIKAAGVTFPTPLLTSSGTFGFGKEMSSFCDINLLGGIVTKSLRLHPFEGNPPPRLWETYCGLLNSIGIPSEGFEDFVTNAVPFLQKVRVPVIVSIAGQSQAEFIELAKRLKLYDFIAALEVNVSCPNLEEGARRFDDNKKVLRHLIQTLKGTTSFPLFIKLSPGDDIVERARCAEDAGADALVVANTLTGMAIDIKKKKPVFKNVFAGLSGPAIKPLILKMVWEVAESCSVPIIASGGVVQAEDALEFLMAGATLVEVGTATFVDPRNIVRITHRLRRLLKEVGLTSASEAINCARR